MIILMIFLSVTYDTQCWYSLLPVQQWTQCWWFFLLCFVYTNLVVYPECWCSLFCGLEKKTNLAVNPVLVFFFSFAFLKTNWAVHPEYWCYFVYQFSSGLSTGVYFFTCWVVDLVQVFIFFTCWIVNLVLVLFFVPV